MFGKAIKLFKIFDFDVKIDLSFVFLVLLITWSLAIGYFPYHYKNFTSSQYWLMGFSGALMIFLSIVFHELSHMLVARKYGLPMRGITLFMFGGLAEMEDIPPNPKTEIFMAAAGPLASIFLGFVFYGLYVTGTASNWAESLNAVMWYSALINWILAGFNLFPAFPLDGGRILRGILWHFKKNLDWATRISSKFGSAFGVFLIIMGILRILNGNFIGGLWFSFIGMFLRMVANQSYQQLKLKTLLQGKKVSEFMNTDVIAVTPDITIKEFIDDYVYKFHHKLFPVIKNSKLAGCVGISDIKRFNKDRWDHEIIEHCMHLCDDKNSISSDLDVLKVFKKMKNGRTSRLMVIDNGKLKGMITLKDLLDILSLKMEIEGD